MKKTFLTLALGIVIGLLGSTTAGALAAIGDKVEATITHFVFIVNGEEKQLDVDPLVINGTSYLPVRALSNMLGYDVTYKAPSIEGEIANILLDKTPMSLAAETTYLLEQEVEPMPTQSDATIEEQIATIDGTIERLREGITAYEGVKANERNSEETKQKFQAAIDKYESQIAELEAQKTELQAQLPTE